MYLSPELDALRQKIDGLDNQIHDLLMERADLIMMISEAKKKQGIQIVQPAREARMLRRLVARHREPLPEEAIVRIWRELVSCVSLLQTGLSVAVYTPDNRPEYWDMARDYFGTVLPMQRANSPQAALNQVIDGKITFAVLPWPEADEKNPWWTTLIERMQDGVHVLQRLPYGDKEHYDFNQHPALVVAKAGFDSSDDDRSFIGLAVNPEVSRARILDIIKSLGHEPGKSYVKLSAHKGDPTYHLIEIGSYLAKDASLLNDIKSKLGEAVTRCEVIGGYPAPLIYKPKSRTSAQTSDK